MRKFLLFTILAQLFTISSYGQFTQEIRGTIIDKASKAQMPGANISITTTSKSLGTISDENGNFTLFNIPVGLVDISVSFVGYEPYAIRNLELTSGKEKIITVELVEKVIKTEEVVVTANKRGDTWNKMAALSARQFSVKETERYAGSIGDPSRMASNFAGVITANDSRNDIIIRGNSPQGLLWKLEGVNIPNPNHFGALGSTGGPVSILNNNQLANSDFFTGAFPAEYGNALSGVFDLKLRNGNNKKHEFLIQTGFNGFELGGEGPISKKQGSSYMINYRYSVLAIMDKLGFDVAGGAVPEYQDLNFKVNLPTKKYGTFSIFGIGGISNIVFKEDSENEQTSYGTTSGVKTRNGSEMAVIGVTNRFFPNDESNIFTTIAYSHQGVDTQIDSISNSGFSKLFYGEKNNENKLSVSTRYTRKFDSQNTMNIGATLEDYSISLADSVDGEAFSPPIPNTYIYHLNIEEHNLLLMQVFGELQHRFTDKFTMYGGVHLQYFYFNQTHAVDPRLSASYQFDNGAKVSIAYGKHSQTQPFYEYFTSSYNRTTKSYSLTNEDLSFSKAHHLVTGFEKMVTKNCKLKVETYYQYLYDIPIERDSSDFSMVNAGNSFHQNRVDSLINNGLAQNYGLELTLERYLDNNYYFLVTGSFFDSKYKASDNLWRNTEFNTNFVINSLGGYRYPITKNLSLDMNIRMVNSGGKRNRYIDLAASQLKGEEVYDDSKSYSKREANYFRLDTRISIIQNKRRFTQEWALDIRNLTGYNNIFTTYYDKSSKSIKNVYQQGFFPIFLYRINF